MLPSVNFSFQNIDIVLVIITPIISEMCFRESSKYIHALFPQEDARTPNITGRTKMLTKVLTLFVPVGLYRSGPFLSS